ncbi:IMP dehydrogenase [Salmonella enterica subsp. enterica]|nr:IMP dehydrogenase [Salmonella enterica subsp. enterica]
MRRAYPLRRRYRSGTGPGSVCARRGVKTISIRQLSAVIECADAAHGSRHDRQRWRLHHAVRRSKSLGGGADFVMLGGMLAGHEESAAAW